MSASIGDGCRSKRYDCFISMPGSQKLAKLGFTWAGPDDDVRGLAQGVYERLRDFHRNPSVFYDRGELDGDRWREDLSTAVLQLRGGGVALILFTAEYLRRKWCLAELHSFLDLNKLSGNRAGEAVKIRVVCLEPFASIKSATVEPSVKEFVGDVNNFQWQGQEQANSDSTRALVLDQICEHVRKYWKENESICLGKDLCDGVYWIEKFFADDDSSVARLARALGFQAQDGISRDSVFSRALTGGKFDASSHSGSFSVTLEALGRAARSCGVSNVDGSVSAADVLAAFSRKWDSSGWEWSIERGKNDICLADSVVKAADVLKKVENGTPPSVVAASSSRAAPPPMLRNGDNFRSPHLLSGQHCIVGLETRAAPHLADLRTLVLSSARGSSLRSLTSESRRIALISIHGESGVGKTSTCKLLCADPVVRNEYSEGAILWINIGRGATEEKVMRELKEAVLECGGKRTAEEIKSSGDIPKALKIANEFFAGRRVLAVIDNVWEATSDSRVENWALELSKIASCHGSVVIMTTRFQDLSENREFERVHLGRFDLSTAESPGWLFAKHLYNKRIQATPDDETDAEYTENRRKALELSCGIPLAISTFAALVLHYQKNGRRAGRVLTQIDQKVVKLVDSSPEKVPKNKIGHNGLFFAMEECLIHLDENDSSCVIPSPLSPRRYGEGKDVRVFDASYSAFPEKSLSSRYAALDMLPPSSLRLPFSILRYLWHVATSEEAKDIAVIFANIGLGRVEEEDTSSGQEGVFSLHDLQHQFCTDFSYSWSDPRADSAAAKCSYLSGHSLFLSSCESYLEPIGESDGPGTGWVRFSTEESLDQQVLAHYLRCNIFRHILAIASKIRTNNGLDTLAGIIMCILCDFRWIRGRIVADGRRFILSDCSAALEMEVGIGADSGHGVKLLTESREKYVRELRQALILFRDDVSPESSGALASFLVQRAGSSMGTRNAESDAFFFAKLALSAEKRVHGLFWKAIAGCDRIWEVGVLKKVVGTLRDPATCTAFGDGAYFVSDSCDGVMRLHDSRHLEPILNLKKRTGGGGYVAVANVGRSENEFLIFFGGYDESVCGWVVGLDDEGAVSKSSFTVGCCEKGVCSLAVSSGGSFVVAGCGDGQVFIWQRRDGAETLGFELVTKFCCSPDGQKARTVCGVVVSDCGDFIAALTGNGKIAFWSSTGGESDGELEHSVAACASRDGAAFHSLLLSKDNSALFVVSHAAYPWAGCEVWDVASRKLILPFLMFSDLKEVTCAALVDTRDTRYSLFVGGFDSKYAFCIAEFSTGGEMKKIARFSVASHPLSLCGIKVGNESRLLVGGLDGCLRVFELKTGGGVLGPSGDTESLQQSMCAAEAASSVPELKAMTAVAVMPFASVVVAGHNDGLFSFWEAESGEFLCFNAEISNNARFEMVSCIDINEDESSAVSGHRDAIVVVWSTSASTWTRRFTLDDDPDLGLKRDWVRPRPAVQCVSILGSLKRIVSVNEEGELRVWDGDFVDKEGEMRVWGGDRRNDFKFGIQLGTDALFSVQTGGRYGFFGARSPCGRFFLWAGDDPCQWTVIDLTDRCVIFQKETNSRKPDWKKVRTEAQNYLRSKNLPSGSEGESFWKPGAMVNNTLVELCGPDSGRSRDLWIISSEYTADRFGYGLNCALRSADGSISAQIPFDFDHRPSSISAAWLSRAKEGDSRQRAVVACILPGQSHPAIMHLVVP